MINLYNSELSLWPAALVLTPKLGIVTPEFAQVWDYGRITPTSAVGRTVESLQSPIGEYFERKHFFNEISPTKIDKLYNVMNDEHANSFLDAILQTSNKSEQDIKNHSFKLVDAFDYFNLEKLHIPAVMVALDNKSVLDDLEFYPARDTCACSCHTTLQKSIYGSIDELIERQSLIISWLKMEAKKELLITEKVGEPILDNIIDRLKANGTLKIYDITLNDLPGYAVLSLYGCSDNSATVKYSAGLSYSLEFNKSLRKSLLELWQSYICVHNFKIGGYNED